METQSRSVMRVLDDSLQRLEDAMENGERRVSPRLAQSLGSSVITIAAGTPISAAMEAVFREQEALLGQRTARVGEGAGRFAAREQHGRDAGSDSTGAGASELRQPALPPLSLREAQVLTARIKSEMNQACLLLAEAHDRRAWKVLGHKTWEHYVRKEIGYSRSRSYEILDQAKAIRSIQAAVGTTKVPEISAYAARQIKPYLPELSNEIRKAIDDAPSQDPEQCMAIVNEVIATARFRGGRQRPSQPAVPSAQVTASLESDRLFSTIRYLAQLGPPSPQLVSAVTGDADWIRATRTAIAWLQQLASRLDTRQAFPPAKLLASAAHRAATTPQAV